MSAREARANATEEQEYFLNSARKAKAELCKNKGFFWGGLFVVYGCCLFVYMCPIAAVTNYHDFSDLSQHRFIILQCWRSEVLLT